MPDWPRAPASPARPAAISFQSSRKNRGGRLSSGACAATCSTSRKGAARRTLSMCDLQRGVYVRPRAHGVTLLPFYRKLPRTLMTKATSMTSRFALFSLIVASVTLLPAAAITQQTVEPGFTSLFNGKDLTGWVYGSAPTAPRTRPARATRSRTASSTPPRTTAATSTPRRSTPTSSSASSSS